MNSRQSSIQHSALGWVKKSIDDHLSEIELDLKRYIEERDETLLESVKQRLSVIRGVLMMVEQYGAAMLTEEMVSLVGFIAAGEQEQGDQSLEVLLRAVMQLPDYLEHIQSGHRDIPIAILPLLNDIRAVRNQDLFSEKLLFLPDLSMHEEDAEVETIDNDANQASRLLARKIRPIYQLALINIIREKSVEESLQRMEKVCETLEERSFSEQIARIWWIIGALVESISRQQLELGVSIKSLLGKVDALFRVILIIGERGLLKRQPVELIKNFLFYIAQPECDGPKAQAIKTAYRLEQFLPSESVRSRVLDNIAGPNQALLKTVAEAMRVDIESVKSTLEVYVNGDLSKAETLRELPREMHIISDTLAMIGLGPQRQLIEAQIETVKAIMAGNQPATEERLLSMAAELLQVEQALEQMQKRQPVGEEESRSETDVSKEYELDNVLTAVVTAALDDIQKTKSAILDFIKDSSHSGNIDLCITLMTESRGALELLNQPRAVAVVDGLLTYLKGYDIVQFMDSSRLDSLSQVVVSLEYYLEALGEHRSDAESILDFADVQLQQLLTNVHVSSDPEESEDLVIVDDEADRPEAIVSTRSPHSVPVVAAEISIDENPEETGAAVTAQQEKADDKSLLVDDLDAGLENIHAQLVGDGSVIEEQPVEPEITEVEVASRSMAENLVKVVVLDDRLEVLKSGSDPEILEIYLEEAEEESKNIARLQQDWLLHPEDDNALKNLRRAFHTIKGSGRLVGAMKIGEFAWDFEQLLNRVIDRTIAPDPQVIEAVGQAAYALPELVNELKTSQAPQMDINYIRGMARALSEFKAEQVLIEHHRQKSITESPYDRITDGLESKGSAEEPSGEESSSLLDEIEPDTMRVDRATQHAMRPRHDLQTDNAEPDAADFDATVIESPRELVLTDEEQVQEFPAGEHSDSQPQDSRQAVDYARTSAEQANQAGEKIDSATIDDFEALTGEIEAIEVIDEIEIEEAPQDEVQTDEVEDQDPDVTAIEVEELFADEIEDLVTESAESELEIEDLAGASPSQIEVEEARIDNLEEIDIRESASQSPQSDEKQQYAGTATEEEQFSEASDQVTQTAGDPPGPFVETTGMQAPGEEAGVTKPVVQEPGAPIGLSFDPDLLIIYHQEVEQHLSIVSSALDRAEQIQELVPGEEIYRALHTINGASRTAEISTIGELASLLEKPLKSAIAQNLALDHEIVALYREGQRALHEMTNSLVATRLLPKIPEQLEISLRALAEDFEVHTLEIPEKEREAGDDFVDTLTMMNESANSAQDDELLAIFIDEANELLEMSDHTLHQWAKQSADDSGALDFTALMELQRYLHTLKGGARMAELKEISDLSHEMESMFIAVIDSRVDKSEDLIELLRNCFDLLHQQVVEAQENRPLSDSSQQVELLKVLRRGGGLLEDVVDDGDIDSEDIDIVSANLPGDPLSGIERPTQDVIKVRADLLDNLVSSAGEVSIYRARMEQQVAGLGSYLGELGQTISRLKSQLRNLEAETDTQIHFSHRTETRDSGHFDPLEMDRYTLIQELSKSLSESVDDLSSLQGMLGEQVKESETLLLQQSRVNTDLQDGLIKSRMVKFSGLLSRLRRLVRQSGQELGKKAELLITGEENEVDNKVLDRMVAPLEHIIRNALSHGIETPVERVKKGKPESGTISIDISRDGSDIVIRMSDDGAGVNIEKVRGRAMQLGLIDKDQQVADADLVQFILEPGFSTAEHVTQLSGRGVGMDVVDIEIKQLGGILQIETNPNGTTFIARLPFTLSINQAILVRTGGEIYAIPLNNIEGVTRLDNQSIAEHYRKEAPELEYAGQRFALHYLSKLVASGHQFKAGDDREKQPVILCRSGDVRVALHVDEIIGNREIVVKTLGKQLSQVKGLSGASILADGSVVLILDVNGLIRQSSTSTAVKIVYRADEAAAGSRNTVMVVDDSITMRRVASKLLQRHNFEVVTAKDGVDALSQLEDVRPDVMLLDIEMPRMDGFELATHMQNEETYSKIPIIMITSRTGEKHRDRAFEIGVTNYMGKPYQEKELIDNIQNALAVGL